jgi:hypothetical protein
VLIFQVIKQQKGVVNITQADAGLLKASRKLTSIIESLNANINDLQLQAHSQASNSNKLEVQQNKHSTRIANKVFEVKSKPIKSNIATMHSSLA